MKSQKNLRLQVRLQSERLAPNQFFSAATALPLAQVRKIPIAYRAGEEELLAIKYVAPTFVD
jgi:hypothetical protein